jgi:hypothetical protein
MSTSKNQARFLEGDWVRCADRDNIGQVVRVEGGPKVQVIFLEGEPAEATVWLDQELLSLLDRAGSSNKGRAGPRATSGRSNHDDHVGGRPNVSAYDSWVMSRVLSSDAPLNGEFDAMVPEYRRIAEHLAHRPLPERQLLFDAWLVGQPDPDAIVKAIAEQDPQGPAPPSETGEDPDDWGPLALEELPEALPFPVEVFPPSLQAYCREVAASKLASIDFVGVAMLAVAGAAIGQSVSINIKHKWTEAALLYCGLVAPPGKVKSPVISTVAEPLTDIDHRLREESQQRIREWRDAKEETEESEDEAAVGPEPPRLRAVVRDITRESLVLVLRDNPRGVLCDPDELAGWVASFGEYKGRGGSDRRFWLSVWGCAPVSVDRKGGREATLVPHPFVTVLGGLPPDMLNVLSDEQGRIDGFIDRILFSYPEEFPVQYWTDEELSAQAERDWAEAIDQLHGTPMDIGDDRRDGPRLVDFTHEARQAWVSWFNVQANEMEEVGDRHAGAWSKMRAHAARFGLIMSRLRAVCEAPYVPSEQLPGPIEAIDVDGAIKLTTYFKSHLLRVAHRMTGGLGDPDASRIIAWIRRKRLSEFRETDVGADLRRFRKDSEALTAALESLLEAGVIRLRLEKPDPSQRGPKPSPMYEVHPDLFGPTSADAREAN